MRPVDRGKRQEVWTFLSSFDFNVFSRIDVTSPDFQRQVERLLIQFVQRNRAFFGQQGRKRMPDVRALITSSSASVTEGLRGHLSGRSATPFGSARPVVSWSKSNDSGRLEPGWEQIASTTMSLQQQLQEARGEIRPGANNDVHPVAPPPASNGTASNGVATASPRRSPRLRVTTQGNGNGNEGAAAVPTARPVGVPPSPRPMPLDERPAVNPSSGPLAQKTSGPLAPPSATSAPVAKSPVPPVAPATDASKPPASSDQPVLRAGTMGDVPASPAKPDEKAASSQERNVPPQAMGSRVPPASPASAVPTAAVDQPTVAQAPAVRQRELTRTEPLAPTLNGQQESATLMLSDEDVVIFEEMRHQLLVWLRVEVVHAGLDLTGQSPTGLIEMLRQQDGVDETRLQVVSTLLNLINQVIANGYATLVEYKQAMMFYLIHTRRAR
jgi:hypothetical protein